MAFITGHGIQRLVPNPQSGRWIKPSPGGGPYIPFAIKTHASGSGMRDVAVPLAPDFETATYSVWVNPEIDYAGDAIITDWGDNAAGGVVNGVYVRIGADMHVRCAVLGTLAASQSVAITAAGVVTAGEWNHIFCEVSSGANGRNKIWVNGEVLQDISRNGHGLIDTVNFDGIGVFSNPNNNGRALTSTCVIDMWGGASDTFEFLPGLPAFASGSSYPASQAGLKPFVDLFPVNLGGGVVGGITPSVFMGNGMDVAAWNLPTNLGTAVLTQGPDNPLIECPVQPLE